jgi:hypothetical protein
MTGHYILICYHYTTRSFPFLQIFDLNTMFRWLKKWWQQKEMTQPWIEQGSSTETWILPGYFMLICYHYTTRSFSFLQIFILNMVFCELKKWWQQKEMTQPWVEQESSTEKWIMTGHFMLMCYHYTTRSLLLNKHPILSLRALSNRLTNDELGKKVNDLALNWTRVLQ